MISEDCLERMERFGGSFVKQLAVLYRYGDHGNKTKLEETFSEYFEKYTNWVD